MKPNKHYRIDEKKIFVAGHSGLLGSSICRWLEREKVTILSVNHCELDLTEQSKVILWMKKNQPDVVINAAGKVGGIYANNAYLADFIYQNLAISQNLIHSVHICEVEKLVMLGSSYSYPSMVPKPIHESSLMDGKPESTNQWYTFAKIAGIKLCEAYRRQYRHDYISILPANLYGPGDSFNSQNSHVIPGLIRRLHEAKNANNSSEVIWWTG